MATYSTYEAKAKFSEIMRRVREGKTVTISYRGEPVAEIRPLPKSPEDLRQRLSRLERDGILHRHGERKGKLRPIARVPGALARFLDERDE